MDYHAQQEEVTTMNRKSSTTLNEKMIEPRFEIIPANRIVKRTIASLPSHSTLSITCSPTKGIEETIETTIALAPHFAKVIPHIAARMITSDSQLDAALDKLQEHNLDEIFVVGSDEQVPKGPYRHSLDLLEGLAAREHGLNRIGVTAYPEGHPQIAKDVLDKDLMDKAALAHYAVTQMCFDPEAVVNWLKDQRDAGLQLPIYVGLPGPVKMDKLLRISARIGVTDSLRFLRRNLRLTKKLLRGYDVSELLTAYAPYLNDSYYEIAGFHTYTFNELDTLKKKLGV